MIYNKEYINSLEALIMDELLPAYLEACRLRGVDPNSKLIIKKLLKIMRSKEEIPAILQASKKLT